MSLKAHLSVVVIGLNEGANLDRCFGSIKKAALEAESFLEGITVIYVDSGSQDASVAIAKRYTDRTFRLTSCPSAAAARTVGLKHATGDLVLFLDGDMELQPNWLRQAVPILLGLGETSNVAGLTGVRDDIYINPSTGEIVGRRKNVYRVSRVRLAPHVGGALLARRLEVELAGGYDPELRRCEEPDLYARIIARGRHILELPVPFIRHFTPPQDHFIRRLLRQLYVNGSSYYFGRSFLSAIKGGYLSGFLRVFPYSLLVWAVDVGGVIAILLGSFGLFFVSQIILIASLGVIGKPKVYLTARARIYGVLLAAWGWVYDRFRKESSMRTGGVQYYEVI